MVNMTLSIPQELSAVMKKHKDVKWSEVARHAIWKKANDLELLEKLTAKSAMTMDNVMELDELIKSAVFNRHRKHEA